MTELGKHQVPALCHIVRSRLIRIVVCWRGEGDLPRNVDGRIVDGAEAKAIIAARHTVPAAAPSAATGRAGEIRDRGAPSAAAGCRRLIRDDELLG
jgi:hypothetical protein